MPYAEMAAYRAAVMMPWDLNLVMFHVAQTKRHDTHWGMVITTIDLGLMMVNVLPGDKHTHPNAM